MKHDIISNKMESIRQTFEAAELLFVLLNFITTGCGETIPECNE